MNPPYRNSVVERIFSRRFPQVRLVVFQAIRARDAVEQNFHYLIFVGKERDLLGLGLIEKCMVPLPDEISLCAELTAAANELWMVTRLTNGQLQVRRELNDNLMPLHPLAPFSVWRWPIRDPEWPIPRLVYNT